MAETLKGMAKVHDMFKRDWRLREIHDEIMMEADYLVSGMQASSPEQVLAWEKGYLQALYPQQRFTLRSALLHVMWAYANELEMMVMRSREAKNTWMLGYSRPANLDSLNAQVDALAERLGL